MPELWEEREGAEEGARGEGTATLMALFGTARGFGLDGDGIKDPLRQCSHINPKTGTQCGHRQRGECCGQHRPKSEIGNLPQMELTAQPAHLVGLVANQDVLNEALEENDLLADFEDALMDITRDVPPIRRQIAARTLTYILRTDWQKVCQWLGGNAELVREMITRVAQGLGVNINLDRSQATSEPVVETRGTGLRGQTVIRRRPVKEETTKPSRTVFTVADEANA